MTRYRGDGFYLFIPLEEPKERLLYPLQQSSCAAIGFLHSGAMSNVSFPFSPHKKCQETRDLFTGSLCCHEQIDTSKFCHILRAFLGCQNVVRGPQIHCHRKVFDVVGHTRAKVPLTVAMDPWRTTHARIFSGNAANFTLLMLNMHQVFVPTQALGPKASHPIDDSFQALGKASHKSVFTTSHLFHGHPLKA